MVKKIVALALGVALVVIAVAFAFVGTGQPVSASGGPGVAVTTLPALGEALYLSDLSAYSSGLAQSASVCLQIDSQQTCNYQYTTVSHSRILSIYFDGDQVYAHATGKLVQKTEQSLTSSSSMEKYDAELLIQNDRFYVRFASYDFSIGITDPNLKEGETIDAVELQKAYAKDIRATAGKWIALSDEEELDEDRAAARLYFNSIVLRCFDWSIAPYVGNIIAEKDAYFTTSGTQWTYAPDDILRISAVIGNYMDPIVYYTLARDVANGQVQDYGSIVVSSWQDTSISAKVRKTLSVGDVFADLEKKGDTL